jgi:putative oxidoreductase
MGLPRTTRIRRPLHISPDRPSMEGGRIPNAQGGGSMPFMSTLNQQAYALMRIVTGLLFLFHGLQKLLGFPKDAPEAPAFILYVAGPIELIGGALIVFGLFTRYAAFLCSGLMAAAYWMAHGTKALYPLVNGGELAALYSFVFLFIASQGSGIWSADDAMGNH